MEFRSYTSKYRLYVVSAPSYASFTAVSVLFQDPALLPGKILQVLGIVNPDAFSAGCRRNIDFSKCLAPSLIFSDIIMVLIAISFCFWLPFFEISFSICGGMMPWIMPAVRFVLFCLFLLLSKFLSFLTYFIHIFLLL